MVMVSTLDGEVDEEVQPGEETAARCSHGAAAALEMAMLSMEMAPGALPRPDRVPKQRLLSPELGFLVAAELRNSSGEIVDSFRVFTAEAIYSPKGVARRCTRWPHHPPAPPPSRSYEGMVWRLWASPRLVLLVPESSGVLEFL